MIKFNERKGNAPPVTRGETIRSWIFFGPVLAVFLYSLLWYFGSPWVNLYWQKDMQCTIESAYAHNSGSKSYNSNEYVRMDSDCGDLRYRGAYHGLSDSEVAEKINEQVAGQRVDMKVSVWNMPFDYLYVYEIDGFDVNK